jgi:hypothetical protein
MFLEELHFLHTPEFYSNEVGITLASNITLLHLFVKHFLLPKRSKCVILYCHQEQLTSR